MYDHLKIEKKWQQIWEKKKLFEADNKSLKPKYYVLDMFPFPSGAGLHVGHVTGYTATDIVSRYKRQKGFNVLHPMGWDSFGLPAEQYAVKTGTHPKVTTEKNVDTYRRQLKSLGFSYDWRREFATSDPKYYKWTQWIFTKLYEKGLAYEAEISVNYCPKLGTVLANEEIEDGNSKVGGYPVERRPLRQWVLKITEYAEQLLTDLDDLDWPDYLKTLQRNWIGKSIGANITFKEEITKADIPVFTTCPHTLYGVTFLVLSPEHPLLEKIVPDSFKRSVTDYQNEVKGKSDLDRTDLSKDKTGVFTGAYAENFLTGEKIPIWIADYVLMSYGTGSIMAVPAHDERDLEFAKKYDINTKQVLDDNSCMINSDLINGLCVSDAIKKMNAYLEEKGHGKKCVTYKLRDWLFSRQRYWGEPFPVLHFEDGTKRALELDELPLTLPELEDYSPPGDGNSALSKADDWLKIQDAKTGKSAKRETNTMPNWAGSCWYYLRFVDPHNEVEIFDKKIETYWLPVDLYIGGVEHAVLHLLYARFWHKVLFDLGIVSTKEPFQTLRNQGLVTSKSYKVKSGEYLSEKDAKQAIKDGTIKKEDMNIQVEKMSKSKLNGVPPDEVIEEFGADSLRLYEMFMGPFDKEKLWNTDAVSGCRRFLDRFFRLITSEKVADIETDEGMKLAHKLVKGVEHDINEMLFNTAIAKMMEFINAFSQLDKYPKNALKMAVQSLSPFAPHIAEECWEILGEKESLMYQAFPEYDEKYLVESTSTYVVQVNGKLRGRFDLPVGKSKEELIEIVKTDKKVSSYIDGKTIVKEIFIPNKLVNFVVK